MKPFIHLIAIVVTLTVLSCNKAGEVENNGISGAWKLVEVFDGYANGGNFQWNAVAGIDSHTFLFAADGKFEQRENLKGDLRICKGSYTFQNGNMLEVTTSCNTTTAKMFVNELTATSLIIDRAGIEGTIRYKYKAVKPLDD